MSTTTKQRPRLPFKPSRRQFGKLALAGAVGGPSLLTSTVSGAARPSVRLGIKLALMAGSESLQKAGLQMGVRHVIVGVGLGRQPQDQYVEHLERLKARYAAMGLTIAGVESHPVPAERIKLGLPGRDEEIANYIAAIKALGQVGIKMICYNFMAGLGWTRTKNDVPERGAALTSEFDRTEAEARGLTRWGEVSEEKMWDNIEYFLKAVIPVAEEASVNMAAHPDDPPLSPLRGIARILTSADNYRRVMNIVPSPVNGVTFCQANFKLMGEDIEALAKEWCSQKKIFFIHLRDVEGTKEHFRETFHDNGPTDMARMLKIYHEYGFDGAIRPDHAPTMEGDRGNASGYGIVGKVLAIGYMKGLMDAQGIPYE